MMINMYICCFCILQKGVKMNSQEFEKCYYCEEEALYTDAIEFKMIAVCKKHFTVDLVS